MNERIKELMVEATNYTNELKPLGMALWTVIRDEKFAELMVKECLTKLTPYLDDQFIGDIESELKEHFGVK